MKNILYQFSEGRTQFGMSRGVKMSFDPQRIKIGCSSLKFKHYLNICTTSGKELSYAVIQ